MCNLLRTVNTHTWFISELYEVNPTSCSILSFKVLLVTFCDNDNYYTFVSVGLTK